MNYVEPLTDENGEARYSSTSKYILSNDKGESIGLLGISKDITREFKIQERFQQEIQYLFDLPQDAYAVIFIDVTDWRIIGQRRQAIHDYEIPLFETMERFLSVARDDVCDESSEAYGFYHLFSQKYLFDIYNRGQRDLVLEYQRQLTDGNDYWIRDEMKLMTDPKTGHLNMMLIVRDIDERKQEQENLAQAATMDELTGLLNRFGSRQQIEDFLEGPGKDGVHAVFMIDVDNFKMVNDTYGHQEGDVLLSQLAHGIKGCFRESDIVSRIGGDEFFVLAKNMPDHDAIRNRAEELLQVARKIRTTNTTALTYVSVGISVYPEDGETLDELYVKADEAMYKAKVLGKNQAAFASDDSGENLWNSKAFEMRYEAYNSQVVDHSNSICYISDMENYDLLHLTKAGMDLYGMTKPEEYLGKKCYKVIMGLDEPCPFCTNSKLKEGEEYRWERYNENINKWFDRTSSIIYLDGRPRHLEIGRDITARKEEISLLSGQLTMEDVLFRCLHTLTKEKDMETAVNLFLEAVGGYHKADRAFIFEVDEEHQLIHNTFEWCAEGKTSRMAYQQNIPYEWVKTWYDKFEKMGEFSVDSLEAELDIDSPLYQQLKGLGIKNLMMAPLIQNGKIVGMIGVKNPTQEAGNLILLRSVSEFVQAELERRRLMKELEHMSYTDALTGLKNRNQYDRELKEFDRRTPEQLGIALLDINGLKRINDNHGHSYGNHVIKETGRIIKENVSGKVFRTGGDEFVVLNEALSKEDFYGEMEALQKIFEKEQCSVSLGYAWREREENIRSLFLEAGEFLAVSKQSYYHTVLQEGQDIGYTSFSGEVMKEIEEGQFVVYYQPQVDIRTGKIIGAEALVRKKDGEDGLIPPNKFISFYEIEGVISYVDLFVLREGCIAIRKWIEKGHHLNLSVNFSRITLLEPDIVDTICSICKEYEVDPKNITIEVTESISKMDHEKLKSLIQDINDAGFTISLDDFGSQYSNLAILAAMDFDEIKFDQSLVTALEHNHKSRVVMENSVKMCRDLDGTNSLAEGIETRGQLDLLLDYQCDYGQGYYFSKPVAINEFEALLEKNEEN